MYIRIPVSSHLARRSFREQEEALHVHTNLWVVSVGPNISSRRRRRHACTCESFCRLTWPKDSFKKRRSTACTYESFGHLTWPKDLFKEAEALHVHANICVIPLGQRSLQAEAEALRVHTNLFDISLGPRISSDEKQDALHVHTNLCVIALGPTISSRRRRNRRWRRRSTACTYESFCHLTWPTDVFEEEEVAMHVHTKLCAISLGPEVSSRGRKK